MAAEVAQANSSSQKEKDAKANRQIRCGTCRMCTSSDCGECMNCLDMPKFGGPGHKKQACTKRKCLQLTPCKTRKDQLPTPKRQRSDATAAMASASGSGLDFTLDDASLVADTHHALADYLLGTTSDTDAGYGTPRADDSLDTAVLFSAARIDGADEVAALQPPHTATLPLSAKALTIATDAPVLYDMGLDSPPRARSPTASGLTTGSAVGATSATPAASPARETKRPLAAASSTLPGSSPPSAASSLIMELQSVCAVTQDDVAATHRVAQLDAKLDWSWLALGNLEDEFILMNDTHQGQHPALTAR
eukprot:CAMPEP_0119416212 /NCGR_PEP_ID=MMETSP1335-20130426/12056_1 /TAXON_ID=259385 /ORGANISM="Chrysoculter rhomboideus, Strain RCC1486" /LENGTH=306 /DNA_ID=CAMNT_0007441317 /DNA_START=44 /DNA_END=964 /DNA_ORIENTATION=-